MRAEAVHSVPETAGLCVGPRPDTSKDQAAACCQTADQCGLAPPFEQDFVIELNSKHHTEQLFDHLTQLLSFPGPLQPVIDTTSMLSN